MQHVHHPGRRPRGRSRLLVATLALVLVACDGLLPNGSLGDGLVERRTGWILRPADTTTSLQLTVVVGSSSCSALADVVAVESADEVEVRATIQTRDDPDTPCTADLTVRDVDLPLDAPLGDRELVGCTPDRSPAADPVDCRDTDRLP